MPEVKIRLIPSFNHLASIMERRNFSATNCLSKLDLTPGAFPDNQASTVEWDPLNPEVWRVVFQLMDELTTHFGLTLSRWHGRDLLARL